MSMMTARLELVYTKLMLSIAKRLQFSTWSREYLMHNHPIEENHVLTRACCPGHPHKTHTYIYHPSIPIINLLAMLNINLVHTNSNLTVILTFDDYTVMEEFMVLSLFAFPLASIKPSSN